MIKNVFVFSLLFLSGCVVYLDDTPSRSSSSSGYGNVWLESPYISCSYDAYWDISDWTFEVYADSYYGAYEVMEVGFYINNYDYQYMDYVGNGWWYRNIVSTYYDCDRYYHFDFVAADYDGFEGYYVYEW